MGSSSCFVVHSNRVFEIFASLLFADQNTGNWLFMNTHHNALSASNFIEDNLVIDSPTLEKPLTYNKSPFLENFHFRWEVIYRMQLWLLVYSIYGQLLTIAVDS